MMSASVQSFSNGPFQKWEETNVTVPFIKLTASSALAPGYMYLLGSV